MNEHSMNERLIGGRLIDERLAGANAVGRALSLLWAVARADEDAALSEHARRLGLPLATAHRLASALVAHGLLRKQERGVFVLGPGAGELAGRAGREASLARIARTPLRALASSHGVTAHLGIWDDEMVTYLVKEPADSPILTREGSKLEGYCSALGKVLLADLPEAGQSLYLASGPFVALTDRTIVDVPALRGCLAEVRRNGYATDDGEVQADLRCLAVPVCRDGRAVAAVSASSLSFSALPDTDLLAALRRTAQAIARRL